MKDKKTFVLFANGLGDVYNSIRSDVSIDIQSRHLVLNNRNAFIYKDKKIEGFSSSDFKICRVYENENRLIYIYMDALKNHFIEVIVESFAHNLTLAAISYASEKELILSLSNINYFQEIIQSRTFYDVVKLLDLLKHEAVFSYIVNKTVDERHHNVYYQLSQGYVPFISLEDERNQKLTGQNIYPTILPSVERTLESYDIIIEEFSALIYELVNYAQYYLHNVLYTVLNNKEILIDYIINFYNYNASIIHYFMKEGYVCENVKNNIICNPFYETVTVIMEK